MKALIIAVALFVSAFAVEVYGQDATPVPKAEPAPKVETPPAPVVMFEQGAIPLRVRVIRVDNSVSCSVPEPGVLSCTAKRAKTGR